MSTYRDIKRGHFIITLPDRAGRSLNGAEANIVGCDLGGTLHLTTSSAHLDPDEARQLADMLAWWAERKHEADPDGEVELNDLFDLLPKGTVLL